MPHVRHRMSAPGKTSISLQCLVPEACRHAGRSVPMSICVTQMSMSRRSNSIDAVNPLIACLVTVYARLRAAAGAQTASRY